MTGDAQRMLGSGHDIGDMPARADLAIWMLRHDANRITGRHSDIRCTATTGTTGIRNQRNQRSGLTVAPPGARMACTFFGGRAMHCRFPVHEQVGVHGATRLEGMIRKDA